MEKIVEVPGVGNVSFPDSMGDEAVAAAIKSNYPQLSATPPPPQEDYGTKIEDFIHGGAMGALKNIPFVGKYMSQPSMAGVVNPSVEKAGETAGRAYEQTLEMMGTGGPLKAGATRLAGILPFLGKATGPILRMAAEALNTGGNAAIHDQPVGPAAAVGAGGAGLTEGLQAIAPKMLQRALGIFGRETQHGQTPGAAILNETSAITPAGIAKQAGAKSSALTTAMEAGVNKATQAGTTISTNPAEQLIDNAMAKAPRNAMNYQAKLQSLRDLLKLDDTGRTNFTPDEILEMKRGLNKEISSWDFASRKSVEPVKRQLYSALDKQLDAVSPGNAEANQKISSLITAQKNAKATALGRGRGMTQMVNRVGVPLLGASIGAGEGYREGGLGKALTYGTAGAIAGTPTAQIAFARMLNAGIPRVIARLLVGLSDKPEATDANAVGK